MRPLRFATLLLTLTAAIPMLAAIAADVTVPVVGYLDMPNDLVYRTELVLTNHRDTMQYVLLTFVANGHAFDYRSFPMEPGETKLLTDAGFGTSSPRQNFIGALRVTATLTPVMDDIEGLIYTPDPAGRVEADAYVIAEWGLGSEGASRQEVRGIPSNEYAVEEAVFLGTRHSYGTGFYTNVGIVNLHPTQTETFYVQYQYQEPVPVVVGPLELRSIRIPGEGAGGRWVRVYPEWSIGEGTPARTTPWVAYTSSVNIITGDAFSGQRIAAPKKFAIQ